MRSARPRRVSPATARTRASESPRSSFARRVSTLPWSGCISRSGRRARRNATRRGLSVPTRAPIGSVASVVPRSRQTRASRGSSRGGYAAIARRGCSSVGTSFAECTARSTEPSSSAATMRPTKAPSPQAVSTGRSSPSVRMIAIAVATPCSARRSATQLAWTSASALPRVPMRKVRVMGRSDRYSENRVRAARSASPLESSRRVARGAWRRPATRRWLICSTSSRS